VNGWDGWVVACLAIMAVALVGMAIGQVVLAVAAARFARQATEAMGDLRKELRPIVEKVQRVTDDASKVTGLALVQVERLDRAVDATARRVDEMLTTIQDSIVGPLRQGSALIAGLRAVMEMFRTAPDRQRRVREDEDALFIG
jgi:hypothetical protein